MNERERDLFAMKILRTGRVLSVTRAYGGGRWTGCFSNHTGHPYADPATAIISGVPQGCHRLGHDDENPCGECDGCLARKFMEGVEPLPPKR